jgi:hypothetical protein
MSEEWIPLSDVYERLCDLRKSPEIADRDLREALAAGVIVARADRDKSREQSVSDLWDEEGFHGYIFDDGLLSFLVWKDAKVAWWDGSLEHRHGCTRFDEEYECEWTIAEGITVNAELVYECWPRLAPLTAPITPTPAAPAEPIKKPKGPPGRPKGSGGYARQDEPFVVEMKQLMDSLQATSAHDAARIVLKKHKDAVPGVAAPAGKQRRLVERYGEKFG